MSSPVAGVRKFPRVRLGHIPTPLDAAANLGGALGVEIWIKRDDCMGLAFSGNKLRQLEFHLGEALARGADTVLVTGSVQSNLARLAAAAACRLGAALAAERRKPYVIHSGVDGPPLGGLGYVVAAEEVADQARSLDLAFDAVVCPSGSGLTHAGLLIGLRTRRETLPVYGICVRRDAARQQDRVARVAKALARMIDCPAVFDAADVALFDTVHPPGYGRLNGAAREAISMAARLEALLLDPVYAGKAMAGLIALVRTGRTAAGSRVLFIHTGGLPAIFADADKLGRWPAGAPGYCSGMRMR